MHCTLGSDDFGGEQLALAMTNGIRLGMVEMMTIRTDINKRNITKDTRIIAKSTLSIRFITK